MEQDPDGAALWRLTVEHSPVGMALVGVDGRLLMVNRALADMLGHDVDDLQRRGFQELTHADDLDADLELFESALAGEIDTYRLRKRYLRADGEVVWGDLSVALVRGSDGGPLHFISQVLDVTEQHRAEARLEAAVRELEHERQSLEAIFETVNVGLLLLDREGRYQRMNRRHAETMSQPFPEGHAGRAGQLGEVYRLDGSPMPREEMPTFRASQGEEFDDYTYWVGADPQRRTAFSTSARQVRGPGGERIGAALAYQEITELVRAMQVKDEFVSSVSHELRTPLTSVLGHLELLADDPDLPPRLAEQIAVVQRNALRLGALVTDLLQVAQAGESGVRLRRHPTDLASLVAEAVDGVRREAAAAGIAVVVEADGDAIVEVDPHRIRQVLDNLLTNAVKYGRAGGAVRVRVEDADGGVEVAVSDTGIGIPADELEHVFDRFFRGGQAASRHIPGTGLGLDIVRSIVHAHGGTIAVESQVGRGSTFTVRLPR